MTDIRLNPADKAVIQVLRDGRNIAANIATETEYERQYITARLRRLEEHGIVNNIGKGVYELISDPLDEEEADSSDSTSTEKIDSRDSQVEQKTTTPDPPPDQLKEESRRTAAEERLEGVDVPGAGEIAEQRREAVLELYDFLRGRAGEIVQTSELKEQIDTDQVGYSSVDSFWSNCLKASGERPNLLTVLPGVEEIGNGRYRYSSP